MATKDSRVARVADGTTDINTLSTLRRLPIIVVPGIMGTRLTDPLTDELVWNPLGFPMLPPLGISPNRFASRTARIQDVSKPLVPDETHDYIVGNSEAGIFLRNASRRIKHYLNIIPDFYGALAVSLDNRLRTSLAPRRIAPQVYCCGYDWRQDNAESAKQLESVVNEAQEDCNGEPVIIVAHSMGGLVSRFFCRNLAGESKVRALFLIASPSLGAPKAYGSLKSGKVDFTLKIPLGILSDDDNRDFSRSIVSIWQLLPNHAYSNVVDGHWVRFDASQTGMSLVAPPDGLPFLQIPALEFSDCRNEVFLYQDAYTGFQDPPSLRNITLQNFATAEQFHFALTEGLDNVTYMHPKTFAVACNNLNTITGWDLPFQGAVRNGDTIQVEFGLGQVGTANGDTTVPAPSALPTKTTHPIIDALLVPGVDHQSLPAASATIEYILSKIASVA